MLVVAETNVALARSRLGLGGWRYTAEFTALATAVPGRRNGGVYAFGEWETGAPGHRAFLRVGWANPDYNVFSNYVGAGWVSTSDTGQFGIAVARGGTGSPYRRLQPSDASELTLEVTLRHQWRDWLAVQPDLQYVVHPGAGARLGNTWVMGMRLIVEPTGH